MDKIIYAASVVSVAILFLTVCGDKTTDPTTIPLNSIPLDIGAKWNYRIDLLSVGDSSYQDSTVAYRIYAIIGDTSINSIDMLMADDTLLSVRSWGLDTLVYRYWLGMAQSRLLLYAMDIDPSDSVPPSFYPTPDIVLDFPLTWGKLWENQSVGMFRDTCRVIGYETVNVAGDSHQCWVVETIPSLNQYGVERRHDWYSDIGLVKSETLLEGIRKQWILVDYFPSNH